jgi:hypothetical protein
MMSDEAKKWIQMSLLLGMVVATAYAGHYLYQRHEDQVSADKRKQAQNVGYSNPDYYVSPKKLYPYDVKSARQLMQQPVWVKEGYRYTYYPYDLARKQVDFAHDGGLLLPIEKLAITDVVVAMPPGKGERRQVMAIFQKDGKSFAVPIGFEADEQYTIYSDEMFFVEDPRDLYKHWPAEVWQAVAQHQVNQGMNELQADFAIGMGVPDASSSSSFEKTVRYPNGGKPVVVIYREGKAAEVKAGSPGS